MMSTPYQDWISETNAAAAQGKAMLTQQLASRLLEKSGPAPTADDINWLDIIIDAYVNAHESESPIYAQVMLDWLGEFQRTFGRSAISAESVTLVCSALSFWQARPNAFNKGEHAHIRAFLGAYLDKVAEFADLPAPMNDAGGNLHEQIVRLYFTSIGSERPAKEALLGRWLPVPQAEAGRSQALSTLRNNRYILEAMALHHPYAVSYDTIHDLFRKSKALPEGERSAFLEQTFTSMHLEESWTQVADGQKQAPRDHFFAELRKRFSPDDFVSIDETLRFIEQVFWLAGDEAGEFAKWKFQITHLIVFKAMERHKKELMSFENCPSHVLQTPNRRTSLQERKGWILAWLTTLKFLYEQIGQEEEAVARTNSSRYLLEHSFTHGSIHLETQYTKVPFGELNEAFA